MKKLLLFLHVLFAVHYASFGQICLGSPDVSGEQNICPGRSYKYETNAAIGFPYRFDIAEWTTNSGNALIKINGTDTRFYASHYLVHRDLSANDITLIENYYPTKITFKTIGLDNDQVTLYYNQPGYPQSVVASIRPDYKVHALPRSVEVSFGNRTYNIIDFHLSRKGITGTCPYYVNRTLNTQKTFIPGNVIIKLTSPQVPACSSGGNFDIRENNITFQTSGYLFNWKLIDPQGVERSNLINGNRNTNNVYISYLDRPGTWNLTCTVGTLCNNQTFTYPINVASPFALQPAEIKVDGSNSGTYASLYPTCPKAYQMGYQLSVPQYSNIPDAQYTWTLPPGWRTYNAQASSSTVVGGYTQFTYNGQYLNNITMDSYIKTNGNIPGGNGQLVIRACNVTSNPITIYVTPNGPLDVRLNPQVTSCLPSVALEPVVVAQAYPVTISWQSTNGGTFASATTDGFAPANTFTASPGTYQVKLNITDARQCVSDYTNTTVIIGGPGVNSAGWNSGILSDVNNWNVISNLAVTDNSDVYFVGQDKITGAASLQYYRYDAGFAKWVPTPAFPQPTTGVRTGTNAIAVAPGVALGVYYVDANNNNIKRLTATGDIPVPAGVNADLIKLDPAGTLNTARLVYHNFQNNFIFSWNPVTPIIPASPFVSLATKYDIGINNGRVFYVNANESAIYYKEFSDNNASNKGTLITSLYSINCYTDIVFDVNGNMYYATCDGNIFVCKRNLGNGYDAPVSIQIPGSRGCDGHFTINAGTGTIYYTGYDNRLYQHYVINFASNQWGNVPATQSFGDIAGRSLVFKTPHLFYVGDNNLVYNLYYFQGCTPSPLRVAGEDTDHIQSENQIYTEGNVLAAAVGAVFPNPFTDQLSVFVEGSGIAELKISDVHGKAVITKEYVFEETSFSTSTLSPGMYICTIVQNGNILYTAKVIKQ
jgi:hypothetical protein